MRPLNIFERIIEWLSDTWKRVSCRHHQIVTLFTGERFTKDGWERCSGVATCRDCGADFHVLIAANDEERKSEDYLGY
jgi:hypothetical protein